jgi:hypothetical protein
LLGGVPAQQLGARVVALARRLHGAQHGFGRLLEPPVRKIIETARELRHQIGRLQPIQLLARAGGTLRAAVGREQLRREPCAGLLGITRRTLA